MDLNELRARIDALDAELVKLLNERTRVVLDIGRVKEREGGEAYVPAREKAVLDRVAGINPGPLPANSIRAIYREIMSASLALERSIKVAYLGPPATFSHQAARSRFGASVEYIACETIPDVFDAVAKGLAEYGVVPVENSTEGAVTSTLDSFVDTPLKVCAEIYLPIAQCLLANAPREQIERLYSLPHVIGQCRLWLQREMAGVEIIPASSTSRAAELAAKDPAAGALASRLAAEVYGLSIIAADIQDSGENKTRFMVLGKSSGPRSGDDKTSLVFAVRHTAGALFGALESFKRFKLNMTRIESRPSKNKAWEYYFFVDVEGHQEDSGVRAALDDMAAHCTFLTVLGSYPRMRET